MDARPMHSREDYGGWEYQSHIIFYMPAKHGIRIVRVLHQRMDARRHV